MKRLHLPPTRKRHSVEINVFVGFKVSDFEHEREFQSDVDPHIDFDSDNARVTTFAVASKCENGI